MGKKNRGKKTTAVKSRRESEGSSGSERDVANLLTDEVSEFTDARNKIVLDHNESSESAEEEELFGLAEEEDESDEEIGEWSKRLKQIKFQSKLDKKKPLPGDAADKSWGKKRAVFYGSGVKRKPKKAESDEEDEWTLEQQEIEKLQKKLDEDIDEEDFLFPSLSKKQQLGEKDDLTVTRHLTEKESDELKKRLHPEADPLRKELDKCIEELEKLKHMKGWKVESRETCFKLLGANIAFYLHLIDSNEDCRGHPVLKRIVQWKKLAKLYEKIPMEQMEATDSSDDESGSNVNRNEIGTMKKRKLTHEDDIRHSRVAQEDSEESDDEIDMEEAQEEEEEIEVGGDKGEPENRPVTYEIEKNKPRKKTVPNNPRVKHREKFRKAKIRRRGKIREYRPEVNKYQGEASGIRAGIIRSIRMK